MGSCQQEVITLEDPMPPPPPCNSCPDGAGSGEASFAKFITIGNSYVAGFQAGALYDESQNNSLAKIISSQLACAGGSDVFNQPDINSFNGFNVQLSNVDQGIILGRLVLLLERNLEAQIRHHGGNHRRVGELGTLVHVEGEDAENMISIDQLAELVD